MNDFASDRNFLFQGFPAHVRFGRGKIGELAEACASLGAKRVLLLSTPGRRDLPERCAALLGASAVGIFDGARMHVPVESVDAAQAAAEALSVDCLVAAGGGSTIGLAKGMALRSGLPIVAIPTTYSGSEMTPIYGLTENGIKRTGRDQRVAPRIVIYDPDLVDGLPPETSVVSGFNAIAHGAEGLYAKDRNPIMSLLAEEGVRALFGGLRGLSGQPDVATAARDDCLYGAWLCGTVLGSVGMSLHHKLCHTLGGSFDLPHAETHTVVLPHALAYNAPAVPEAMAVLGRALDVPASDVPQALQQTATALGAPSGLRELGMKESDVDRATQIALANAYWNPRPLEEGALRALLQRAWAGAPAAN